MSKKTILLLLLLVAVATIYIVWVRKPWRTISEGRTDFAIADTGSITRIFMADKEGHQVLLTKQQNGSWTLNNAYTADITKVQLLLTTLHDMQVRNPVTEKQMNTVVGTLATAGIKVEVYNQNGLEKVLYIGPATVDQTGTMALIEGSEAPFILHIPGFVGYLTPRFYPFAIQWRSKLVFNTPAEQIEKVQVEYPNTPTQSFLVTNGIEPTLTPLQTNQPTVTGSPKLKYYLGCFTQLYGEGFDPDITKAQVDSIRKQKPFSIITLTAAGGNQHKLELYYKGITEKTKARYDDKGNELPYDGGTYYGFVNGDSTVLYVQQYSFNKVLQTVQTLAENP